LKTVGNLSKANNGFKKNDYIIMILNLRLGLADEGANSCQNRKQ